MLTTVLPTTRSVLLLCASLVTACGPSSASHARHGSKTSHGRAGSGGMIAGTVQDGPTGSPLSFATVTAMPPGGDPISVSTDAQGRYRLRGLAPGRYNVICYYAQQTERLHNVSVGAHSTTRLNISFGQRRGAGAAPVAAAGGAAVRGVSTRRVRSGGIKGAIIDGQTKQLLAGAVVAATTPGLSDAVMAIADEHGRYTFPTLAPGTYSLSVYYHLSDRGNIEVRRTGVKVNRGEFIEIDLVLDVQPEL